MAELLKKSAVEQLLNLFKRNALTGKWPEYERVTCQTDIIPLFVDGVSCAPISASGFCIRRGFLCEIRCPSWRFGLCLTDWFQCLPITTVVITDKVPLENMQASYCYWRRDDRNANRNKKYVISRDVFNLMPSDGTYSNGDDDYDPIKFYNSGPERAREALGIGCVRLGQQRANLSELPAEQCVPLLWTATA